MTEEEDRKKKVEANIRELSTQLKQKKALYENMQHKYDAAHADVAKQTEEYEQKEELLQSLQTGVASREGQESGYQGQLQDAKNRASAAATEQEQAKLKISHLEKRIKEEEPKAKKAKGQNSTLLKDLEGLRAQATKLEADLAKLGFKPDQEGDMQKEEAQIQRRVRELREQSDALKRKVANIDFSYSDPSPNFDRSRVKGLVAQLFTLQKQHLKAATAVEICAGGRLYNVVVDTAETGTQLLQNGKLRKRVTIIPLNKISAFRTSSEVLAPSKFSITQLTLDRALAPPSDWHQERLTLHFLS
jgi:structural maintenance of chromosome 2